MRLSFVKNLGLLVLAVVGLPSRSFAGTIVTVPTGLAPGSQYRLVFVTADTYTATSSSITDYNNDVNTEAKAVSALAALGTTWLDIGSTATVNAIDNIGIDSGVPIYDLDGNLAANDAGTEAGGMFNGSDNLLTPSDSIGYSEFGPIYPTYVWTGSTSKGDTFAGAGLGDPGGLVIIGQAYPPFVCSCQPWFTAGYGAVVGETLPLYGISGVLTVPESATPEPSTTAMMILAGALTFFAKRWVHGNRRATRTLC